jgi:hypothetical protein
MRFEVQLSAVNLQYAGVHHIHKMSGFSESKAVFIFFIVLSVIICFFTTYFYFIENKETPDDGYLVLYGIAILLVVMVYLVRRSEKKLENKTP